MGHAINSLCALVLAFGLGGGSAITLRTVGHGYYSGVEKPSRQVVKSQAEWEKLWAQHRARGGEEAKPPQVDWSKEMVLAAYMGSRNTGGHAVKIEEAKEQNGKLMVTVSEKKPGPGSITAQVITTPFHAVAVSKSALAVEWQTVQK